MIQTIPLHITVKLTVDGTNKAKDMLESIVKMTEDVAKNHPDTKIEHIEVVFEGY